MIKKLLIIGFLFWITGVWLVTTHPVFNNYQFDMFRTPVFGAILVFFIGPFLEELIFRSWTLWMKKHSARKRFFMPVALISSFLFALAHVNYQSVRFDFNLLGVVLYTFGLGLMLSAIAYQLHLKYAVAAHSLYNIAVYLFPLAFSSTSYTNHCISCHVKLIPLWSAAQTQIQYSGNKLYFSGKPSDFFNNVYKQDSLPCQYLLHSLYNVEIKCLRQNDSCKELLSVSKNTLLDFLKIKEKKEQKNVYEIVMIPNTADTSRIFYTTGKSFANMLTRQTKDIFIVSSEIENDKYTIKTDFIFVKNANEAIELLKKNKILFRKRKITVCTLFYE